MSDKKIAVIFPGMGYHSDKPLLYFSKRLAREKGYEVVEAHYEFPFKAKEIMNDKVRMKEAFEEAVSQIQEDLTGIKFDEYSDVVFIGKSIGTALAAHFDRALGVGARHIVFTPVPQTFEMLKKDAGIVFHGLADPWCKTEIADARSKELGLELHKIDRANHSLETDSPMEDLISLQAVMKRVESFLI
jgi:phosphoglycolate phosphatase